MSPKDFETYGRIQKKLYPLVKPNLSVFNQNELEVMDNICSELAESSATKISEYSHEELGWIFANPFEEIPFEAFLLTNDIEITEDDYLWAEQIIGKSKT